MKSLKIQRRGHPLAAGASIYDWKDADLVIADLERICKENK